jgi:hypothetical protein
VSGLVDTEVFVGGMEVVDIRLPLEELLDMADARLLVIGKLVITCCFTLALVNENV